MINTQTFHLIFPCLFLKSSSFIVDATASERKDFIQEIKLTKKIAQGNNPQVVNMLGAVTIQEPLCIITEFVEHEDLLKYLRASRKQAGFYGCVIRGS